MKIKYPEYQLMQDNILITRRWEGKGVIDAWAHYKLEKINYDFSDDRVKKAFRDQFEQLIAAAGVPGTIQVLPVVTHADQAVKEWSKKSKAIPIREFVDDYYQRLAHHLNSRYSAEYQPYLIVNLFTAEMEDEVFKALKLFQGDTVKEKVKNGFTDIWNRYISTVEGLVHISESDWREIVNKERSMKIRLERFTSLDRCTTRDIEWLVARNAWKGIGEPPLISRMRDWSIPFKVEDELYQPTRSLNFLLNGQTDFLPKHVEVNQLAGTGYQMYLTIAEFPDQGLNFPGNEYLYHALQAEFPVEIVVKFRPMKKQKIRKQIHNTKLDIDDQQELSGSFNYEQYENVNQLDQDLKKSRERMMETTFSFGLNSYDLELLKDNVQSFISHMETVNVQVVNPFGDQELGFIDFLPGTPIVLAPDYRHYTFPKGIAGGIPNGSMSIGNPSGIYIGWRGTLSSPVYTEYPTLPKRGMSGGGAAFGPPGSGKSVLLNLLGVETVYHGGRALLFDPKGDRTHWDKTIPGLQGYTSVISFSEKDGMADKGRFDPFRIFQDNLQKATSIFTDQWSFWLSLPAYDLRLTALEEAVLILQEYKPEERNTALLLDEMEQIGKKESVTKAEYLQLVRQIRAKAHHPLVALMVGDGTEKPFTTDNLLNVIQIHGLNLPNREEGQKETILTSEQRVSVGALMGIMSFSFKFLERRDILNFVGNDESWRVSQIPEGRQFFSKLNREGRAVNNLIFYATQQPKDTEGMEQFLSNIFIYKQKGETNARDACKMLGIPETEENIQRILSLEKYNCIFRDEYERTAQMRVEVADPRLLRAFDTNPV